MLYLGPAIGPDHSLGQGRTRRSGSRSASCLRGVMSRGKVMSCVSGMARAHNTGTAHPCARFDNVRCEMEDEEGKKRKNLEAILDFRQTRAD